ncbi:MAG: GTPase Era [Lachnospiraceae bacterium]|nr:GTPase Era [Lachnospiraceae bacterium]
MENQYNKKSGFVTIIGRPNVGKSTLMNHLIGQKIAITSEKPQTTRNKIQTVYTDERGQIVFLDTPGVHKAKNKLGEFMDKAIFGSFEEADLVMWLVEPSLKIGKGELAIAEKLKQVRVPIILVVNKIDTISREELIKVLEVYKDLFKFNEIVPVSGLKSKNTDTLLEVIYKFLPYGPMYYDEDTVTNVQEREILAELIREKALRLLDDEIPHGIAVVIEKTKFRPGNEILDVEATIICEKDSHKGIIIGKGGEMIKKIGTIARKEAESMFEYHINLKLFVKCKKDWRDSESLLKNLGFFNEED